MAVKRLFRLLFLVQVLLLLLLPGTVWAATYYVAPSGSDADPGTATQPFRTIQRGVQAVTAGDTVIIRDGVYTGGIEITQPGTAAQPIVFRAAGRGAVIDGSGSERDAFYINGADLNPDYWQGGDMYIQVTGLTIRNAVRAGLRISCAHHVSVQNCVLEDNGTWGIFTDYSNYTLLEGNQCSGSKAEHGIYVSNSSDYPTMRGNIVHHNNCSGIQINADPAMPDGDGITTGAVIEQNIIYENGQSGAAAINLASVRDSVIRNNLVYDNYAGGIAAWGDGNGPAWGCKNNRLSNNTIYFRPGQGRWTISLKEGSSGNQVRNNILCGGHRGAFEYDTALCLNGLQMDYNLLFSADLGAVVVGQDDDIDEPQFFTLSQWRTFSQQDGHSLSAKPPAVFVNHAGADFQLRPGSPALDAGDPAPQYNDPDGSRNDLGAYGGPAALTPRPMALPWTLLLLED
jgi:parallel beta-helix repeat protein